MKNFEPIDTEIDDLDEWSQSDCVEYLIRLRSRIQALASFTNYLLDNTDCEEQMTREFILFNQYTLKKWHVGVSLNILTVRKKENENTK